MANDQPILVMAGRPFIIDIARQELRQYNRSNNWIPFADLQDVGPHYILQLNDRILIPPEVIEKPHSLSELARLGINIASQEQHWGIFIGDEKLARRLSGELPHIDIAGTGFTIDVRLRELRETKAPWNRLDLSEMSIAPSGEAYLCFYNTESHEEFTVDDDLLEMPENVVLLEIPNERVLDPVALAREYDLGDTDLLTRYPLKTGITATVKPISESGLASLIELNRQLQTNETRQAKRGR